MDCIECRLRELELWFVASHIPYNGTQKDMFISKMKRRGDDYANMVVSRIEEFWKLCEEKKKQSE